MASREMAQCRAEHKVRFSLVCKERPTRHVTDREPHEPTDQHLGGSTRDTGCVYDCQPQGAPAKFPFQFAPSPTLKEMAMRMAIDKRIPFRRLCILDDGVAHAV